MASNHQLRLTLAINQYDHVRDLAYGDISADGLALTCLQLPVEEIFFRFVRHREWDVSELSLAKYAALRSSGDESLVAIPVFPSRAFRHSAIFVRDDGPVDAPEKLAGGRIGIPEWTQTAVVCVRGILAEEFGLPLQDITWIQAGTNEAGRIEGISLQLHEGYTVTAAQGQTLNEMLLAGDLDAVIAAHPPEGFERGDGRIVRLFSDYRTIEEAFYRERNVFPIMHVIVLRADVYQRHPWTAMALYKAFTQAKDRSIARARDINAPLFPIPWSPANAENAAHVFGSDFWPYGIDANRSTLEWFLRTAYDQGVCARLLDVEELFVPEVRESYRI